MEYPYVDSNLTFDEALNRHPEIFGHPSIIGFMEVLQDEIDELKAQVSDTEERAEEVIEGLDYDIEVLEKQVKELKAQIGCDKND